jgi:uncharacterized protein YndB with AHSA1/START domain
MTEPLRMTFEVNRAVEHVFEVWTEQFARWWPTDHTVTGEADLRVVFEPKPGGRIFEETAGGDTHEWGEITTWDPPHRLGYLWYLRRDRADATNVEITFVDRGNSTRVEIEHRGWERLGARGPDFRTGNQAGWNGVLPHFIAACTDDTYREGTHP